MSNKFRQIRKLNIKGSDKGYSQCFICIFFIGLMLYSCSTTKNLPEGRYLLDKIDVNIDNKDIPKAEMEALVKQKPNDPKLRLRLYNWAGNDSSWFKNLIRKAGSPPVLYEKVQAESSVNEIHIELLNRGYLNNEVNFSVDTTGKKIKVNYNIVSNDPYRIRNYDIDISELRIDSLLGRRIERGRTLLKPGTIFDMRILEDERTMSSRILRNVGYYNSTLDNLHYLADTTLRSDQVDLTLILQDTTAIHPYYIRKVSVFSGYDPLDNEDYKIVDSVFHKGIWVYYDYKYFLKPDILRRNILIYSGRPYTERLVTRTYNYLNALGSIGRTNIQFNEVFENDTAFLDCNIYLSQSNIHNVEVGIDGTNKAGDLGIATNLSYTHHNIFNGAEAWNIRLRGAYEFVNSKGDDMLTNNYYEFGIQTGLSFPRIHLPFIGEKVRQRFNVNTQYNVSFDIQNRLEYTRDFFSFSWKNRWENDSRTLSQSLNILDINYIMMPSVSDDFNRYLQMENNSLTRYSYENVFTTGISYNLIYTNPNRGRYRQRLYTIRFNAESSGNLLNGLFSLFNAKKTNGQYNILGNPFAQYVKGDISYTQTIHFNDKNSIAYRAFIGAAFPYGNSTVNDSMQGRMSILPFEKKFYSGGPNSVRGWSTRYLGPGSYSGDISNPAIHVGDLKLELNFEYRYKWIKWLEFAAFTDAGNVWTFENYENQQGGQFRLNRFYKELAIGAGVGVRIDLSFLIIRIDGAKRVYDPSRESKDRWTFFSEGLKGNSAVYFAIGYPF